MSTSYLCKLFPEIQNTETELFSVLEQKIVTQYILNAPVISRYIKVVLCYEIVVRKRPLIHETE